MVIRSCEDIDEIHRVWFDFRSTFFTDDFKWKLSSQKLIQRIVEFCLETDGIELIECEDININKSYVVLIPHKNDLCYMGTTVVFVSTSQSPVCFFVKPEENSTFLSAFKNLDKYFKQVRKNVKQRQRKLRQNFGMLE